MPRTDIKKPLAIIILFLMFFLVSCRITYTNSELQQTHETHQNNQNNTSVTDTTVITVPEITSEIIITEPIVITVASHSEYSEITAADISNITDITETEEIPGVAETAETVETVAITEITATAAITSITSTEIPTVTGIQTTKATEPATVRQEIITTSEAAEITAAMPVTTIPATEPPPAMEITSITAAEPETEPVTTVPATTAAPTPAVKPLHIPIFMYHTSSENNPGGLPDLYVKPSEFEKQIKYLTENNYTFCTFDDWYNLRNIEKPVFITFDDGYEENYTEIFPILKKYNAKITIFLVTNPKSGIRLTAEVVREMSDSGLVKFESHTITHANLIEISSDDEELTRELKNSKLLIEEMTGKTVLALSYPNGGYNSKVKEKTREFYLFAISVNYGMHRTNKDDDYEIRRFSVGRNTSINEFIKLLRG